MNAPSRNALLAAGAGSALGAVARYLVSLWLLATLGPAFPWGTLAVNVLGSFLIGLAAAAFTGGGGWRGSAAARQFLVAGFCGGFTTFSIFSLEMLLFLQEGDLARAGLYLTASLVLWLAAVWSGHALGDRLCRSRDKA
jgi:fluoride exporter